MIMQGVLNAQKNCRCAHAEMVSEFLRWYVYIYDIYRRELTKTEIWTKRVNEMQPQDKTSWHASSFCQLTHKFQGFYGISKKN